MKTLSTVGVYNICWWCGRGRRSVFAFFALCWPTIFLPLASRHNFFLLPFKCHTALILFTTVPFITRKPFFSLHFISHFYFEMKIKTKQIKWFVYAFFFTYVKCYLWVGMCVTMCACTTGKQSFSHLHDVYVCLCMRMMSIFAGVANVCISILRCVALPVWYLIII